MAFADLMGATSAAASDAASQDLFTSKCAGCHQNGGNILAGNATLFPDDLLRNGISGPDDLYRIIYSGKGKMPGYGADCAPRGACTFGPRLADDQIRGLAAYVQEQAEAKWGAAAK